MRPPSITTSTQNDDLSSSKGQTPTLNVVPIKRALLTLENDGRIISKIEQNYYQNGEINNVLSLDNSKIVPSTKKENSNCKSLVIGKNSNRALSFSPSFTSNPSSSFSSSSTTLSNIKRVSSDLDKYISLTKSKSNEKLPLLVNKKIVTRKKDSIVELVNCDKRNGEQQQKTTTTTKESIGATVATLVHKRISADSSGILESGSASRLDGGRKIRLKADNRRSLQLPFNFKASSDCDSDSDETSASHQLSRRKQIHSWYASSEYETLFEELENETKDNLACNNLAGARNSYTNGTQESASLLENHGANHNFIPRTRRSIACTNTQSQIIQSEGPHVLPSLGGPSQPTRRRVGQFFKSLVGRKSTKENNSTVNASLISSNELKQEKTDLTDNSFSNLPHTARRIGNSTTSLNIVNQKLWSVVPLLRRENSCSSLNHPLKVGHSTSSTNAAGLRKCNTVLALTQSTSSHLEPITPLNRLRKNASFGTCSRCSSLLSLAAGSKYSLNVSNGGFVPVNSKVTSTTDVTDNAVISQKRCPTPQQLNYSCKLCLGDVKLDKLTKISHCGCSFCTECMMAYVEFEILEGAYEISCPDAMCQSQGILTISEIMLLASNSLMDKHQRYRLNLEVELDINRTWCPKAGCETVCLVDPKQAEKPITIQPSSSQLQIPCAVHCPSCEDYFCSGCKKTWHPSVSCEENSRKLAADGLEDSLGIPFDSDLIKCCPMCSVPIEKDEGCAQMMCKRCKHVFCWYCLASLDEDFLLRHYDKGPCKNKLGHSRASVVWHRAQVIGIFAGFGILLLVASPLLLLAAPCIVCCKCRICSGATKLEDNENEFDDVTALHR